MIAIENVLVRIDTFTFPMDFVAWGIEGDLKNLKILKRPLPSSSQAWIDINKGELTLLVGEEKARFNLHQTFDGARDNHVQKILQLASIKKAHV